MPKARARPAKVGTRLAAQRFDIALRAINEGVYDWDIARGTTYYSERVTAAVGLSAKELKKPADWHNRIHPEDRPRFDAALVAHFKGRTERFECDLSALRAADARDLRPLMDLWRGRFEKEAFTGGAAA